MITKSNISGKILNTLRRSGRGTVFIAKDFLHYGGLLAVNKALARMCQSGDIQKVARGIYVFPRKNARLGITIPPTVDALAAALARQTGSQIAPSPATAALGLGLTTQVPGKSIYHTNGRNRTVQAGGHTIVFKHGLPKDLPLHHPASVAVMQGLRALGPRQVTPEIQRHLRKIVPQKSWRQIAKNATYATGWLGDAVREIFTVAGE